jgi:hypothetical protein
MSALFLIFAVQTGQSIAASGGRVGGDCTQLSELLAFISEETNYSPIQRCPQIVDVKRINFVPDFDTENVPYHQEPLALFLPVEFRILLGPELDMSTPLGRSYLLRELVHAHQILNNAADGIPCIGWLEGESYHVQAKFLKAHQLFEDAFDVELLGQLNSACAHFLHPWAE